MDLRVGFKQHTFSRVPEFRSSHGRNEQLRERNQQRSGGFHLKSRNHQGWGLNPSPASGSRAVVAGTIGNLPRDRFRVQKLDMEMRRISTSQHCSCEFQLSIASKGKTKVCVLCFKDPFTIPWAARSVFLDDLLGDPSDFLGRHMQAPITGAFLRAIATGCRSESEKGKPNKPSAFDLCALIQDVSY